MCSRMSTSKVTCAESQLCPQASQGKPSNFVTNEAAAKNPRNVRGCGSFDHDRSSRQNTPARCCKCSPWLSNGGALRLDRPRFGTLLGRAARARSNKSQPLSASARAPAHNADRLGVWAAEGVDAKGGPSEDSFCRVCRPIAVAMGQKAGKKWTATADLQPTFLLPPTHLGPLRDTPTQISPNKVGRLPGHSAWS